MSPDVTRRRTQPQARDSSHASLALNACWTRQPAGDSRASAAASCFAAASPKSGFVRVSVLCSVTLPHRPLPGPGELCRAGEARYERWNGSNGARGVPRTATVLYLRSTPRIARARRYHYCCIAGGGQAARQRGGSKMEQSHRARSPAVLACAAGRRWTGRGSSLRQKSLRCCVDICLVRAEESPNGSAVGYRVTEGALRYEAAEAARARGRPR